MDLFLCCIITAISIWLVLKTDSNLTYDQREYITLQLEDILTPKKIQTADLKIHNLSMITKGKEYKIIDQILFEGFQSFAQYEKTNPTDIQLTDPELRSRLLYYSKKYKYRFLANNLSFSSAI